MRPLFLGLSLLFTSGCGIAVQSIAGWNEQTKVPVEKQHTAAIDSNPRGASVARVVDGQRLTLGVTPFEDTVTYRAVETLETPKYWGLLGTGIAEVVAGAVFAAVGARQNGGCGVMTSGCSGGDPFIGTGGVLFAFGAIDLIWGLSRAMTAPTVTKTTIPEPELEYVVTREGTEKIATLLVPKAQSVMLDLGQVDPDVRARRIIAVMNVEDANHGTVDAVGEGLMRNLSDQLRIHVAQRGLKTIDRSTQDRAFERQLQALKTESYQDCYDDTCQIELGKALAASHILRSRITKFGSRCVLNGELIDLSEEVTIRAASANGDCRDEGFLEMSAAVARDLTNR